MSDSNKGIFLAIGGAVVLALVAGAVYFLVIAPRGERRRLQQEVEKWGVKWQSARDCLVGPEPGSSDAYEAVILREALSTEDVVTSLVECKDALAALRRSAGYSAGAGVEKAWEDSQKKVTSLAEAHAWRIGNTNRSVPEMRKSLGNAVADLDRAYASLRSKADMDPARPPGKHLPTLPGGRVIADAGGKPIAPSAINVSGNVVVAVGAIGDRQWLVRDAGTGTPQVIPIGADTVAGIDGGGWGVWGEELEEDGSFEVRSGPVDTLGDPAGDGSLIAKLKKGESATAQFALAAGPVRVALYQTVAEDESTGAEWLARSRDGGASWPEKIQLVRFGPEGSADFQLTTDPAQARADVFFSAADGSPRWLVLDPDSIGGRLTPARGEIPIAPPCAAGRRTWWLGDDDTVYTTEEPGQPLRPVPGSNEGVSIMACAGDRLLAKSDVEFATAPGVRVLVCRPDACNATLIPAALGARSASALGDKRGPLVATEADGVVVVWSGDPEKKQDFKPIEIARLAGEQQLAGLVEWKGNVHLVTRTEKTLHIVPVAGP